MAAYSAAAPAVMWGVDFVTTAVDQVFECIDLKYGDEFHAARRSEVSGRIQRVRDVVITVVRAEDLGRPGLSVETLRNLRG